MENQVDRLDESHDKEQTALKEAHKKEDHINLLRFILALWFTFSCGLIIGGYVTRIPWLTLIGATLGIFGMILLFLLYKKIVDYVYDRRPSKSDRE